jgi:hypothetical protein
LSQKPSFSKKLGFYFWLCGERFISGFHRVQKVARHGIIMNG